MSGKFHSTFLAFFLGYYTYSLTTKTAYLWALLTFDLKFMWEMQILRFSYNLNTVRQIPVYQRLTKRFL